MLQSTIQKSKVLQRGLARKLGIQAKWLPISNWSESTNDLRSGSHTSQFLPSIHNIAQLLRSQVILFNSRKKWGLLFALATISGMFCLPTTLDQIQNGKVGSFDNGVNVLINSVLPLSTLLIITGMYVLNDLFDADLDRVNGKTNRPIPSQRDRQKFLSYR